MVAKFPVRECQILCKEFVYQDRWLLTNRWRNWRKSRYQLIMTDGNTNAFNFISKFIIVRSSNSFCCSIYAKFSVQIDNGGDNRGRGRTVRVEDSIRPSTEADTAVQSKFALQSEGLQQQLLWIACLWVHLSIICFPKNTPMSIVALTKNSREEQLS